MRGASWTVSPGVVLGLELSAAGLALITGVLALTRYYSRKNDTLLLIGAGMIGTAVLDAYHLWVATGGGSWLMPADPVATEPWSWFGSRVTLSLLLLWSWTTWRQEVGDRPRPLNELRVMFEVAALTVLSITLFGLVSLPPAIRPDAAVPRPFEFLPGVLFAVTAGGYLLKGNWRSWPFEVWLIPALIVGAATQWLFMPFSAASDDALATVSYALRVLSYGFIFVGLVASMYGLYRRLERSALLIEHSNEALRGEVAHRKRAESKARDSEERYRTILEAIEEGYFEVDLAGNFAFWNSSLARLLGYRPERLAGLNYRAYTREGKAEAVFETFSRVYRTGRPVRAFEWEVVRPDGSPRFVEASACPIRGSDDEIVGFRGIVRDITSRRRAEERLQETTRELARSSEELRQFTHFAANDLQAPLRMVAGYTELLARRYEGRLDEEADGFIRHTIDGVRRMQRMIRDLLDYARVQTNARPFETVSLDEALSRALVALEAEIEDSGARITRDELPEVSGDFGQLAEVFEELIENAIKFRGSAPLEIHIGVREGPADWKLFVRDNGTGIDPESGNRVFEIFQRLHARDESEGTGIGLAISRRIIQRHGGSIWLEPSPGRGSTFFFTLPRRHRESEPPDAQDLPVATEGATGSAEGATASDRRAGAAEVGEAPGAGTRRGVAAGADEAEGDADEVDAAVDEAHASGNGPDAAASDEEGGGTDGESRPREAEVLNWSSRHTSTS